MSEIQEILTRFWDQIDRATERAFGISQRIAEIPTRLVLPSECDRQLLTTAATKLVAEHRGTILEFLNRP